MSGLAQAMDIPKAYRDIEHQYQIPEGLLYAIALAESGRTVQGKRVAWPWTLNVQGKGYYFESRPKMQAFLMEQMAHTDLIDVGPMQINLRWHQYRVQHPMAFTQLWINVQTGAKVLTEAYQRHQDWNKAIGAYHSGNAQRAKAYAVRVNKIWSLNRGYL